MENLTEVKSQSMMMNSTIPVESVIHELENVKESKYSKLFVTSPLSESNKAFHSTDDTMSVASPFGEENCLVYWYTTNTIKADRSTDSNESALYKIPHGIGEPRGYDMLIRSFLSFPLPELTVKDYETGRYRIAWTEDIAIHMLVQGVLLTGKSAFSKIDNYYDLARSRYNVDVNDQPAFNYDIGNRPELTDWCTSLPATKVRFIPPWFYSRRVPNTAFQLFRLSQYNPLIHKYVFNLSIPKLLKVMYRSEEHEAWRHVTLTNDQLKSILDGLPDNNNFMMQHPEMFAEVGSITDTQKLEVYLNKKPNIPNNPDIFYIRDVIAVDLKKLAKYGGVYEINVKHPTDCLIRNYYLLVQNETALRKNDYSNFTMNSENGGEEPGPVETISCYIGSDTKFEELDADSLSFTLAQGKYPTTTKKHGIYPYCISCKSDSDGVDVGTLSTVETKFLIRFKQSSSEDKFIVRCRVELFKEAKFELNGTITI